MSAAAKIRKRQNVRKDEDKVSCPFRDCSRVFTDFALLWPTEIPVVDPGVERPQGGIFGPLTMFDGDPNFGCFRSLELGIE